LSVCWGQTITQILHVSPPEIVYSKEKKKENRGSKGPRGGKRPSKMNEKGLKAQKKVKKNWGGGESRGWGKRKSGSVWPGVPI